MNWIKFKKRKKVPTNDSCEQILDDIVKNSGTEGKSVVNLYDIRLYDATAGVTEYPPTIDSATAYLNRADVQLAIHAIPNTTWSECSNSVSQHLQSGVNYNSTLTHVTNLLNEGIRVLLYNGQFDLICNHIGTSFLIDKITHSQWSQIATYQTTSRYTWWNGETVAGYGKSAGNFTYLQVLGGGHMVPMDQPANCQDMLIRFLKKISFNDTNEPTPNIVTTGPHVVRRSVFFLTIFSTFVICALIAAVIGYLVFKNQKSAYVNLNSDI